MNTNNQQQVSPKGTTKRRTNVQSASSVGADVATVANDLKQLTKVVQKLRELVIHQGKTIRSLKSRNANLEQRVSSVAHSVNKQR